MHPITTTGPKGHDCPRCSLTAAMSEKAAREPRLQHYYRRLTRLFATAAHSRSCVHRDEEPTHKEITECKQPT